MPKWSPFSVAKFFATPRTPLQTKWPRKWPSGVKPSRTESTKRSQLRFTPLAAGKIDPWIIRLLMTVQDLLAKGKNEDALELCHEELTFAYLHHNGVHDCYHRVISLFTRHDDFEAATSLCNRMADEGFIAHSKTLMALMRKMHTHDLKHIEQIQAMLTTGALQLDTLAFKTILDSMVLRDSSPEALENAFGAYSASRGEGWIAPPSIYGTVIKAHALAGQWDRAQEWLESYRKAISLRKEKPDVASPAMSMSTKDIDSDPSGAPGARFTLEQPLQNEVPPSKEDPNFPYTAVLMGYVKSPAPLLQRIDWLFERMGLDGITPDISMCNMLIAAFSRWGMSDRAYALYRSMLAPDSASLPDAYTFRHLFIMLNPNRRREINLPADMTVRQLFKEMIVLERLRLYPQKPQPHKNLISTATFNCALRTFIAQYDYAAAWTILSCFTRHHVSPDRDTMRNVIVGLLRRMGKEVKQKSTTDNIIWVDRFLGERRSTMTQTPNKTMLAKFLFGVGRDAVTELEASRCETYLKPSLEINSDTEHAMNFLVGILRVSLQASLGFPHPTQRQVFADKAIKMAMLQARSDMIPRGRLHRN